jgi:hypothetical protein
MFPAVEFPAGAQRLRLSRIALYRLLRGYRQRQRPQTSSLLPWTRGRPLNSRHLNKEREDLISASVREFFLVRERPSLVRWLHWCRAVLNL